MDKQLLEQEAMERYPFKPSDSVTIRNSYADRQIGYIAGATSSSTVKNLEREVEGLKGLIETGVKLAQSTSNLIQDIKGKPNDTRYSTHTKAALLALENWLNKKTENNL